MAAAEGFREDEMKYIRRDTDKFFKVTPLIKQIIDHILDDYSPPSEGITDLELTEEPSFEEFIYLNPIEGLPVHPVWDANWDVNFDSMYILVNKGIPLFSILYYKTYKQEVNLNGYPLEVFDDENELMDVVTWFTEQSYDYIKMLSDFIRHRFDKEFMQKMVYLLQSPNQEKRLVFFEEYKRGG